VALGEKDFSPLIIKMKEEGVAVIYYSGYPTEAGLSFHSPSVRPRSQLAAHRPLPLLTEEYSKISGPAGEETNDVPARPA